MNCPQPSQPPAAGLSRPERSSDRYFLIDAVKACACLLIVGHHLAFYGPMSDVVAAAWPTAMDWLYAHGRLAVQFFLVCAGFLTAGSLSRFESLGWDQALHLAWQRYLRLAIPLLAALTFTLGVTEGLRPYFAHASLSATPDLWQALAHLLLLQDVLDLEALSAGIWYVAIDFQLYAMALLSLVLVKAWPRPAGLKLSVDWAYRLRWGLWLGGLLASLGWWNLHAD
ncbi:acyltransferase family protein [Limnohabitans sp.]|uniref:acyltransferase family protein n=1 Tax=Limnohabitans sp. TaxID=1907725 RepID=UPI0037BFE66A